MKKLMFATALVASAAAFADAPTAINATSFEGYSAGPVIADKGDVVESGAAGGYFCFTGGDTDGSLVKTFGGDNLTAPSARAYYYASASNDKYLELSTEGGTLWRSINTIQGSANAYTLGTEETVAATGTYLDTLVQFTPTEDGNGPTDLEVGVDKLAIWLNVDQQTGTTNLMVRAGWYDVNATPIATNFVLTGKTVVAGEWYRLTIKAIDNIIDTTGMYSEIWKIPAFVIRVDGVEMASAVPPIDASLADLDGAIASDFTTLVSAGKVFPSLVVGTCGVPSKLQGVGFKGSGALDDIVWTEDDLFAIPAGIDFSLTWPSGLTAVSYSINGGEAVAISGSSPFAVPGLAANDVVTFIIQNADGAQKTLTGTAGTDAGIDATGTTFGWPEYLGAAVDGAYEIDDLAELILFQKGVAAGLETASTTFKLTDDVTLTAPWPGVGIQNAKDLISYNRTNSSKEDYITQEEADRREALFAAAAFKGTFDGQNHTVSGFQMQGGGLDYCGFFNATMGATIKNFKIAYAGSLFAADTTSSSAESGGTFVGVSAGTTNQNLTTVAGTVSCSKGFGGIVGYFARGSLIEYCTNNVNMTSLKPNKCGGIAMITQNAPAVTMRNCQNNGTIAGSNETGGLIGYIGLNTTVADCSSTVAHKLMHHQDNTVTIQGVITVADLTTTNSYTGAATPGLNFATVDNGVATFVADGALAAGNTYKVMHVAAATFNFTAAGTIAFDTSLASPSSWAITAAEGLTLTDETVGTVKTYTAAAQGGAQYQVTDGDTVIPITPQPEDFDLMVAAAAQLDPPVALDTNDVTAVNALLATPIPGSGGVLAWQAAFLGVEPSTNGLAQVAITSISFDENGKVVVEMADGVTLKTGRGVDIKLKLMVSSNLTDWTLNQTVTNVKEFEPVQPEAGETKKFYKVVVEFAAPQN